MSQLLKITKKSCLKIFHKISPLKPMSPKKLEEEDEISNVHHIVTSRCEEVLSDPIKEYSTENKLNTKSHNFQENETVQVYETTSTHEVDSFSFLNEFDSNAMFQCLTSRLFVTSDGYEFQRLQQLRSDTASEIVPYEPECTVDEVVFEKVKYNKHVRYFRRTPSAVSLDDVDDDSTRNKSELHTDTLAVPPKRAENAAAAQLSYSNNGIYQPPPAVQTIPQNITAYVPMNVMNLEIKNPGKFESVVIAEKRDRFDKSMPVVKWDINGNSLDDEFYVGDGWNETVDINWNNSNDRRIAHFKLDTESQQSSFRSSSTTLETWLDEDLFGSSFNEKRHYNNVLCQPKV